MENFNDYLGKEYFYIAIGYSLSVKKGIVSEIEVKTSGAHPQPQIILTMNIIEDAEGNIVQNIDVKGCVVLDFNSIGNPLCFLENRLFTNRDSAEVMCKKLLKKEIKRV